MTESTISVIYLHQNSEYVHDCAELLNKQWRRSFSARIQSIEKCFKDLPDSILLIEEISGEKRVIGHSRLTRVLEDNNGCWIGSVVISEEKRKKGYGKYLMNITEDYARKLNFTTAYLNTHDQQGFYEHLGYTYCDPVSSISFKSHGWMTKGAFNTINKSSENISLGSTHSDSYNNEKNLKKCFDNGKPINANIPPPPPPPPLPGIKLIPLDSSLGQYWMKKAL